MGNIGKERRRIEVLPIREPVAEPSPPASPVRPAEPLREPAPTK